MADKIDRDEALGAARTWLNENCPTRLIKEYDASRLADFALQYHADREAEVRRGIADELAEIYRLPNAEYRALEYIKKIRGDAIKENK